MREGFIAVAEEPPPEVPAAQVVELPAPAAWPMTIKLRNKPIIGNKGALLHELTFREPTGGDIMRQGNPCWIRSDGELMIDDQKMLRMMAQLSGVLTPLLEALHPKDYNSCAYRLRPFFIPDWEAW
jgi:hypothetical protein